MLSGVQVELSIEPPVVQRFSQAIIRCNYDLLGDPLYSVKFYRGVYEFYRYTPGDRDPTKVFYLGDYIDIDVSTKPLHILNLNI